jgi:hypothetical protein
MRRKVTGLFIAWVLLAASGCQKKAIGEGFFLPGTGPDFDKRNVSELHICTAGESHHKNCFASSAPIISSRILSNKIGSAMAELRRKLSRVRWTQGVWE